MGKTYVKNKDLGLHRLPGPFAFFFQSFQKRKIAGKSSSNAMVRAKKMWLNLPPEKKALWLAVAKDAVKARRAEREVLLGVKEPVAGQAAERDEPVCEGAEAMPIDISFLAFTFRAINKIGEGAYGKVYKVVSRGSLREPMAAKVGIDLTHEMEIMQRVSHPSVMSAFGIGSTLVPRAAQVLIMPLGDCSASALRDSRLGFCRLTGSWLLTWQTQTCGPYRPVPPATKNPRSSCRVAWRHGRFSIKSSWD